MFNQTVLMSGAEFFDDSFAINAYMDADLAVDVDKAINEHKQIQKALETAGVEVVKVDAPADCQDGVYTANWALCLGNNAVMSRLPNKRQTEEPYAREILKKQNKKLIEVPAGLRFSGQGDALPSGEYLFVGSQYRTDREVHSFLAEHTNLEVISLTTIPKMDQNGQPVTNEVTGWPDSFFYDLDLALAVITPELIAWCPDAFTPESQDKIAKLRVKKLEVLLEEAVRGFACNLVSTGKTVIMSAHASVLQASLEAHGFQTITPEVTELGKGGGYIRCSTLTL